MITLREKLVQAYDNEIPKKIKNNLVFSKAALKKTLELITQRYIEIFEKAMEPTFSHKHWDEEMQKTWLNLLHMEKEYLQNSLKDKFIKFYEKNNSKIAEIKTEMDQVIAEEQKQYTKAMTKLVMTFKQQLKNTKIFMEKIKSLMMKL